MRERHCRKGDDRYARVTRSSLRSPSCCFTQLVGMTVARTSRIRRRQDRAVIHAAHYFRSVVSRAALGACMRAFLSAWEGRGQQDGKGKGALQHFSSLPRLVVLSAPLRISSLLSLPHPTRPPPPSLLTPLKGRAALCFRFLLRVSLAGFYLLSLWRWTAAVDRVHRPCLPACVCRFA